MAPEEKQLSIGEIVGAVSGTVEELEEYVTENALQAEQLDRLIEAEKNAKDRKTAIDFLNKKREQLEEEAKIGEAEKDIHEVEQILEEFKRSDSSSANSHNLSASQAIKILSQQTEDVRSTLEKENFGLEDLKMLKRSEKSYKSRVSVLRKIDSEIKQVIRTKNISEAEEELQELEKTLSNIASTPGDQDTPKSREQTTEKSQEISEDSESDGTDKEKNPTRTSEEPSSEKVQESEQEESKDDSKSGGESDSAKTEEDINKLTDEELREMIQGPAEEVLNKISEKAANENQRAEIKKQVRKIMVEELKDEFPEQKLEKISTKDMLKIMAEIQQNQATDSASEVQDSEEQKDKEKMEEEAEEDLQMLMGAGISEDDSETKKSKIPSIESVENQIKNRLSRKPEEDEEDKTKGIEKEQVLNLLEQYRKLPEREATVKTAHVIKGYVEYVKHVDRELTYSELADRLDESEQEQRKLAGFLNDMSKSEYTGKLSIDSKEFIQSSIEVAKEM